MSFISEILYPIDICGSMHHSITHRKSNRMQQCIKILFNIYMDSVQQLHVQQPSTYAKPEAASAVLGS
jgi:hypothetical protein